MKPFYSTLLAILILTLISPAYSCSGGDRFVIEGHVADGAAINIRYVYYDSETHAARNGLLATKDGRFTIEGSIKKPTVVEVLDNDFRILAMVYVDKGDDMKLDIAPGRPLEAKAEGNEISRRWTQYLNGLAALRQPDLDDSIFSYVKAHPDDIVSALLALGNYEESEGLPDRETLLAAIDSKAIPAELFLAFNSHDYSKADISKEPLEEISYVTPADTTAESTPYGTDLTIIAISDLSPMDQRYTLKDSLKTLSERIGGDLLILELSALADHQQWLQSVRGDTISWSRGWLPAGVGDPALARYRLTSMPSYLLFNRQGAPLYIGTSIDSLVVNAAEQKPGHR